MSAWAWRLTYWTALVDSGEAPTRKEAARAVAVAEMRHIARGLDPDGLAWWVGEVAA